MKPFITDEFLLRSRKAADLYNAHAKDLPVIDYHCHLPPADIAANRSFQNLFEIWLEGDHYKWRAMRSNGESEELCTGAAEPYDKFMAWARTVPHTLRNPLYHWTHLELKRYFDIDELLDERSAPAVWEKAGRMLAEPDLAVRGILQRFRVAAICTTDDPADSLEHHAKIADSNLSTKVFPAFRPDKAMLVADPKSYNAYLDKLARAADVDIRSLADLLEALARRHEFFHQHGCRLSDHGIESTPADFPDEAKTAKIFDKARSGRMPDPDERGKLAAFLMLYFGRLDAGRGWTKQLHLGAMRNNNTRMFERLGPDTGFDSIADPPQARALAAYLDRLARDGALPKMILYNLNPADTYVMGTMLGNFQDGSVPGKLQLGSGWWFLDHREGMEWQMNALSNLGLLSRFVGMLTDSRSFMSFPRHEYFRRVLCNLIGEDIERGEIPDDEELAGPMIENICHGNAASYFELDL